MTRQETDNYYKAKDRATFLLQSILGNTHAVEHTYHRCLGGMDERITDYARSVAFSPDRHGLYEQLCLLRYFRLATLYEIRRGAYRAFMIHAENTRQDGATRRAYKMTPCQCYLSAWIFGFFTDTDRGKVRMTRTAFLFVARKFSKTGFAALIETFYFLYYGEQNSEIYICANSNDQANIAFTEVKLQLAQYEKHAAGNYPDKKRKYKYGDKSAAWCNGKCFRTIGRMTSNFKTKDGYKAEVAHIDEYGSAEDTATRKGSAVRNVMESSMGIRRQPLTLVTTTASAVIDGPCAREVERYKGLLLEELSLAESPRKTDTDNVLPFVCQCDLLDDITDEDAWYKGQPHLGVTVMPSFYRERLAAACGDTDQRLEFQTKYLNMFVRDEARAWYTKEAADALMRKDCDFFADRDRLGTCVCAVDLMRSGDMAAVCYLGLDGEEKEFRAHVDYYMPEDAVPAHPNRVLYEEWHSLGFLKYTKGATIDGRAIADEIVANGRRLDGRLARVRYDAAYAQDFANEMRTTDGVSPDTVISVKQNRFVYNVALQYFEIMADRSHYGLAVDYNPIFSWNLQNCVMTIDTAGLRMPDKGRSVNDKIDGADAILMCAYDVQENL